jgi:hypothetical protein
MDLNSLLSAIFAATAMIAALAAFIKATTILSVELRRWFQKR